nr:MAG TPA: hypothetical protein [Caudoviricetes sp.]
MVCMERKHYKSVSTRIVTGAPTTNIYYYLTRPAKKIPTYVIRRHVCHCCI